MPRLHARDHSQLLEPRDVLLVQAFNVDQLIPPVARPVLFFGIFDRIQRGADSPIADRMDENLEFHQVQPRHHLLEFLRWIVQLTARAGAVRVRLEQRSGVRLDHVIDIQLHRRDPKPVVVILLPRLVEPLQCFLACATAMKQCHLESRGQLALTAQARINVQILQV